MYVVYNDAGAIIQTILGPDESYGPDVLDKHNQKWLFVSQRSMIDPHQFYVDVATKALLEKQPMALTVDKVEIVADGKDTATVNGIPEGAAISILCDGKPQFANVIGRESLEITSLSPATYFVSATCAGYLPANLTVVAK
ncbi:MAG: hypothetical protein WBA62_22035 [Xanthobacteraceae bacterium]